MKPGKTNNYIVDSVYIGVIVEIDSRENAFL